MVRHFKRATIMMMMMRFIAWIHSLSILTPSISATKIMKMKQIMNKQTKKEEKESSYKSA